MRRLLIILCAIGLLFPACTAFADSVRADLLLGAGEFTTCSWVRWYAAYNGADYNPALGSAYVASDGYSGYSLPSQNNSVADGWIRSTNANLNPLTNAVFKLIDIDTVRYQYLAPKGSYSGAGELSIDMHVAVDSSKESRPAPGDTITFRVDRIRMSNFNNLPSNTTVKYRLRLVFDSGGLVTEPLDASSTEFGHEISAVVPATAKDVNLQVDVYTNGNLGNVEPGIYVSGAHLYVRRAGNNDYYAWQMPIPRERSIKTQNAFFSPYSTDSYDALCDYDCLTADEGVYACFEAFRNINPNLKLFLYMSGSMCLDSHDSSGEDKLFKLAPMSFADVRKNHSNWLYTGGKGIGGYVYNINYPERYYIRISNPAYQQKWADLVIARATQLGVDGIWVDDMVAYDGTQSDINRYAWEVQQFAHAVYPKLKAAGLKVIQNAATLHITGIKGPGPNNGTVFFNPFWVPDADYPASAGYSANTPANVPDVFFQEYGFLRPRTDQNVYDGDYWLQCLNDMDEIKRWNTAINPQTGAPKLGANEKRELYMWVVGRDFPNDPAYGENGWLNYVLCSYLLAQNDWTSVGAKIEKLAAGVYPTAYPNIDYSITKKLGTPAGDHLPYNGDDYCRYRLYSATADGGVGGLVVVNANPAESRTFRVDFDAVDDGMLIPSGTVITLPPHSGRILLKSEKKLYVSIDVPTNVEPGGTLTITVKYTNASTNDIKNVLVQARVPAEMQYVTGSAEASGGTYNATDRSISWVIPSVSAGQSGYRTYKATVK